MRLDVFGGSEVRRQQRHSGVIRSRSDRVKAGAVLASRALLTTIAVLAFWFTAAAQAQPFSNPGFEDGIVGWQTAGSATVSGTRIIETDQTDWTVAPYTGQGSMLVLEPKGAPMKDAAWTGLNLPQATRDYLTGNSSSHMDYAYVPEKCSWIREKLHDGVELRS